MNDDTKAMRPEDVTRLVAERLNAATRQVPQPCTSHRRCWPTRRTGR
jgi:hypothetical protein